MIAGTCKEGLTDREKWKFSLQEGYIPHLARVLDRKTLLNAVFCAD